MLKPVGMEGIYNPGTRKPYRNVRLAELLEESGFDVTGETAKFMDPKTGGDAETRSLLNHVMKNTYVEEDEYCKPAGLLLAKLCSEARVHIPNDWCSDEKISAAIDAVDRASSPGYPFIKTYRGFNNGEVIDMLGTKEMIRLVREAIAKEEQDPTKLFVKWEPHKLNKVENDMERLISSIPLIAQIRDRVIFGPLEAALRAAYPNIPVATGWADKLGVHHSLLRQFRKKGRKLGLDKGTWDWTVTLLHLMILYHFLIAMHTYSDLETEQEHKAAVDRHFRLMYGPGHKFISSNGMAFVQELAGIWKSGGFMTLTGNAIMNAGSDIWAQLKMGRTPEQIAAYKMAAFGDDTLQDVADDLDVDEYIRTLRSSGAIIKDEDIDLSESLDGLEFCGHKIKYLEVELKRSPFRPVEKNWYWSLIPTRKGKMLANLLRTEPSNVLSALNSARINWVNDLETYTQLTNAAVAWIKEEPGGLGEVNKLLSYGKCMETMHGRLLEA